MRKPPDHDKLRTIIVDPVRARERQEAEPTEGVWHHEIVGARLLEAAATVRRMPMNIFPKQFGTAWPHHYDLVGQQQLQNELMQAGKLQEWQREQNRVRIQPSGREIERAEEALGWMKYLKDDQEASRIIGHWANTTYDPDNEVPAIVRPGLRIIARCLRRDRVPVRP
jgi:hypothetical protein